MKQWREAHHIRHDPKRLVAQGYDATVDRDMEWAQQARSEECACYTDLLYDRLRAHAKLLDLGCDAGLPTTRALAQHFRMIRLDVSAQQLTRAKRYVPTVAFI